MGTGRGRRVPAACLWLNRWELDSWYHCTDGYSVLINSLTQIISPVRRAPRAKSVRAGGWEGRCHPPGSLTPSLGSKGIWTLCRADVSGANPTEQFNCYYLLNSFLHLLVSFSEKEWSSWYLSLFYFLLLSFPHFFLLFAFVCACVSLSPLLILLCFFPCFSTLFLGTRKKLQKQGMKICHMNSYKHECAGSVGVAAKPDHSSNEARDTYGSDCMTSNQWYQGTELNDHSRSFHSSFIFLWTVSFRQFRPN